MHATSESRLGLSRKALAVHVGVFVFGMVFATWWQPRASSSSCVMVRPPVADTDLALSAFRDWHDDPQHWRAGEPVIVAKSATSRPFYTFVYSPSVDQWTSGEILKSGTWHKTLIDTMEAFLQSRLRYGKAVNVLDIGANLGFFTLAAASLGSKVHVYAIEASPHHARMLRASLVFNDFSDRVTLFNSAVASKPSDKPLQLCEIDKGNRAGTMITESADTDALCAQVPVSTVDKLLGDEVKIDFLKMDIEGFEPYALAGADRLLSRHLPSVIILEYNTIMLKEGSGWAVSLLKRGYTAKDFYSLKTFAPTQSAEFEAFLNNLRDHVPSGHTDISFTIA